MSRFIEVTMLGLTFSDTTVERDKQLLNTDYIRRVISSRGHTELLLSNKEDILVKETYEEIKAMIMYDPAVADIVMKGNQHD